MKGREERGRGWRSRLYVSTRFQNRQDGWMRTTRNDDDGLMTKILLSLEQDEGASPCFTCLVQFRSFLFFFGLVEKKKIETSGSGGGGITRRKALRYPGEMQNSKSNGVIQKQKIIINVSIHIHTSQSEAKRN